MEDEGKRLKGFLVSLEMTRKRKKHEGERSVFSYATDNRVAINLTYYAKDSSELARAEDFDARLRLEREEA